MGNTLKFKIGDYVLLSNPCVPRFFMTVGRIVSITPRGFYEVKLLNGNPYLNNIHLPKGIHWTNTNVYMLAKEMTKLTEEEYLIEAL